jgi:hypothetical protein
MTKNMDMESLHGRVEMYIKVNIKMTKETDTVSLSGQMGQYIKESGNLELSMEKGNCGYLMESIKKESLKIINLNVCYPIN